MLADSLAGLDPHASVVVYCASGYRSLIAASVLSAAGFIDVSDLLGGYRRLGGRRVSRPSTSDDAGDLGATPQVGARAAKALVDAGATLLDVREPDEWRAEHAPEALLMPMGQSCDTPVAELPRDRAGRRRVPFGRALGGGHRFAAERGDSMPSTSSGGHVCLGRRRPPGEPTGPDAGLVVHRDEPLNCETSIPALIGGVVMPSARFYVRNHFPTPNLDVTTWRLEVNGLVDRPLRLSLRDLQNMRSQTLVATLECAGNGRSMFEPAGRRRAMAPRRGEHGGVDRRAARRGARPRRPDTDRHDDRAPRRRRRERRRVGRAGPLRAQPVARRRAWRRGAARLRDERRAASAPARLSRCASSSPAGTP